VPKTSDAARDRRLMEAAVGGDRAAYARLFQRHAERLQRLAYLILHDAAHAEDALQETFTRGLDKIQTWRGEAKPDVWLYSIALNVCRQQLRKEGVREASADPADLEGARRPGRTPRGVFTSVLRREASRHLAIALGFLTDLQREVFVLHYVEGLPYDAIAPLLGVSVVGARGLAHRAKEVLRAKLPPNISLPRGS
jgi:RNA polymerase sigma-70 factor (ECF subfamily)